MQITFAIVFFAAIAYAGWTLYSEYKNSTENPGWHRWLDAAQGSATILWSKFVMLVGSLTGLLVSVTDYFNEPAISNAIKTYMTPQAWTAVMLAVTVITIWARKRTISR